MSVQDALDFIQGVSTDAPLRGKVGDIGEGAGLEDLVRIGSEYGFHFTAGQLREAFSRDCTMRRAFYDRSEERSAQSGRNSR